MTNRPTGEQQFWEDVERREKLRDVWRIDEFSSLEQRLCVRREALDYHIRLIDKNLCASKEIYSLVRQSYNKLIVEEAQRIVDTYNADGTLKET